MSERPKHSKIGASSMYRWKACPGSVKLSEGAPNHSSLYAQHGSVAHDIIGYAMEQAFSENKPTKEILQDYWDAITVYSDFVEAIKAQNPDCAVHIEHSFDMSFIFPNLYGTADCVIWHPKRKFLQVIDYKHGQGISVEVENNLQLSYYAYGAITTLGYTPKWVELIIIQPRCYHPKGKIRNWRVPITYFIDFKADLIESANATLKKNAPLSAGDHCMFCPAKTLCPEKHNVALKDAKREFNFYTDPKKDFKPIKETQK